MGGESCCWEFPVHAQIIPTAPHANVDNAAVAVAVAVAAGGHTIDPDISLWTE